MNQCQSTHNCLNPLISIVHTIFGKLYATIDDAQKLQLRFVHTFVYLSQTKCRTHLGWNFINGIDR